MKEISIYNNRIVNLASGVAYWGGRAGTIHPAAERRDGLFIFMFCYLFIFVIVIFVVMLAANTKATPSCKERTLFVTSDLNIN